MNESYIFTHLTVVLVIAAISGILLNRARQPVLIGYIMAGVLVGPNVLRFITSEDQVAFYSELGILLLMFVIGLDLNVKSFMAMWKIPTAFTVLQVTLNSCLAILFTKISGVNTGVSLLYAFIASLSSTAAIVKILDSMNESKTDIGHITMGILISQDIAVVPMMLIMDSFKNGTPQFNWKMVTVVSSAIIIIAAIMKYLSSNKKITFSGAYFSSNQELTPVIALSLCFISAFLVTKIGLSEAYGAFLVGLLIGNIIKDRHAIIETIVPIQSILLMVFFISVGMMFDLKYLYKHFFLVISTLILLTSCKIIINTLLFMMFRIKLAKSVGLGIILAQLGEFSFILSEKAISVQIINHDSRKLIICVTAISLALSPLFLIIARRMFWLSIMGKNSISDILRIIYSREYIKNVKEKIGGFI